MIWWMKTENMVDENGGNQRKPKEPNLKGLSPSDQVRAWWVKPEKIGDK